MKKYAPEFSPGHSLKHASLFSGIGGFDYAAEMIGWQNMLHCEINPFAQKILKHYWPNAKSYSNIKETDFLPHRGTIDILTGGFPCQPYSNAGKRKGTADERHLWPEMLRAIREISPSWVVGENVRGLTNWNGGLVFDEVQSNLEAEGYEVLPFLLPSCGVNAPHRRDRIWFVAHTDSNGQYRSNSQYEVNTGKAGEHAQRDVKSLCFNASNGRKYWERFPTQSLFSNGNDGLSDELDGITFSKWREESVKAGGNAIVHQVALQIFYVIQEYEKRKS